MRPSFVSALAAVRLYAPLIVFFAVTLLVLRDAGSGVGFVAGCVFAMALALHALVFGSAAALKAFPTVLARLLVAVGALTSVAGAMISSAPYASELVEAGLCAATAAGAQLIFSVLIGRAPTLREGDAP